MYQSKSAQEKRFFHYQQNLNFLNNIKQVQPKLARQIYDEMYYKQHAQKAYRHLVAFLNNHLDTTETHMCSQDYSGIKFSKVPAKAMKLSARDLLELKVIDETFTKMTEDEIAKAKGLRIKVIRFKSGMSYDELANNSPLGRYAEGKLRLLNGHYPIGEPEVGDLIKIVE